MKKSLLLAWLSLSFFFIGWIVDAQALSMWDDIFKAGETPTTNDYKRLLTEHDTDRWYSDLDATVCNFTDWKFEIISPIIEDYDFFEAAAYRLYVSPYSLDQLKAEDPSIDTNNIFVRESRPSNWSNSVEFNLSDLVLSPNQIYYTFIFPISTYDEIGVPSDISCISSSYNMCFAGENGCQELNDMLRPKAVCGNNIVEEWEDCNSCPQDLWDACNISQDEDLNEQNENSKEHMSAGDCTADMKFANITHSINGDTINLKWTSIGNCSVKIAIYDPTEEAFVNLATVPMSDEKYSYKMKWNGEHTFILDNGQGEVNYKVDASISTPDPEIVPPATGPAENIFIIVIAAIVIYGIYTLFFRKAE